MNRWQFQRQKLPAGHDMLLPLAKDLVKEPDTNAFSRRAQLAKLFDKRMGMVERKAQPRLLRHKVVSQAGIVQEQGATKQTRIG